MFCVSCFTQIKLTLPPYERSATKKGFGVMGQEAFIYHRACCMEHQNHMGASADLGAAAITDSNIRRL